MTLESLKATLLADPEIKRYYDELTPEFEKALEKFKKKQEETIQRYLVKYKSNWADEMYIYGLNVLTEEDKVWFESLKITDDKPLTHYVGSNQEIEYYSSKEFLRCYTWTPITESEYEVVKKLIGSEYGKFFYPEIDEEEEDDDDQSK